jgi:hypothetical protein
MIGVIIVCVWLILPNCLDWYQSTYYSLASSVSIGFDKPDETLLTQIVGFYETLIYYQFGIIGVLLVVCFLYTNHISKRHAETIVKEETRSDEFKLQFKEHFQQVIKKCTEEIGKDCLIELFNENEIHGNLNKLTQKMNKIEKDIKNLTNKIENNRNKQNNNRPVQKNSKPKKIKNPKEVSHGNDT